MYKLHKIVKVKLKDFTSSKKPAEQVVDDKGYRHEIDSRGSQ